MAENMLNLPIPCDDETRERLQAAVNSPPCFVNYLPRQWWSGPNNTLPEAYVYIPPNSVPLFDAEGDGESPELASVKLFTPDGSWTWYLIDWDPATNIAFALVDGHEAEYGDVSLDELRQARGPMGLPIERDIHWKPRPHREILQEIGRR